MWRYEIWKNNNWIYFSIECNKELDKLAGLTDECPKFISPPLIGIRIIPYIHICLDSTSCHKYIYSMYIMYMYYLFWIFPNIGLKVKCFKSISPQFVGLHITFEYICAKDCLFWIYQTSCFCSSSREFRSVCCCKMVTSSETSLSSSPTKTVIATNMTRTILKEWRRARIIIFQLWLQCLDCNTVENGSL